MPSSESEDFESADEGRNSPNKKERKKRLSSSNYSDNIESDLGNKQNFTSTSDSKNVVESTVGWDDFDIDEGDGLPTNINCDKSYNTKLPMEKKTTDNVTNSKNKVNFSKTEDTGWNDFDDWGDDTTNKVKKDQALEPKQQHDKNIQEVTECMATASTKNDSWGWGWGVESILSTATAGISTLTNQVSQGISTVLETSIGAPDPEELARKSSRDVENKYNRQESLPKDSENEEQDLEEAKNNASEAPFPFGSLISGVTKFVETTGTKVLAGGLDTLETIGKKTMEVLQDGDPRLAKKRAMLGLDAAKKPVLSQVLREAKAKADEEDRIKEQKREAKEVHYESLFDDYEGLVHLEALEMLSRQVSMRIDERIRATEPSKRQDIKETLQQVAELCEMPEEDDDEEEESSGTSKPDALHERLLASTRDIGLKMQYQPLIKQYTEAFDWLSSETNLTERAIYKKAVSCLAQATALSVELYHKTAELLLVKQRRSTADEADALTQMTTVLTKHIGDIAVLFIEQLNLLVTEDKEQINVHVTNIFLEAENSSKYIQNAFQLALPIIQIGAV